jgi:hypothetical protein
LTNSPWGNVPELPPEQPKDDKKFDFSVKDMANKAGFLFACVEHNFKYDTLPKIMGIRSMSILLHISYNPSFDTLTLDNEVPDGYFRVKSPESPLGFEEYKIERENAKDIPISTSEYRSDKPDSLPASGGES